MSSVHPTACVSEEVQLGEGVEIGPHCVVSGAVTIGDRVKLLSGVSIQGPVVIGSNTVIYPGASIGYEPQDYKFKPGAMTAGVVIGSDNIIREQVTIHSASNDHTPTRVGDRCMLMVGSHAGHDVSIGSDVIIVNGSMLGGHCIVQDRVLISGLCAIHQFCRLGFQSMCAGGATLTGELPPFCMAVDRNMIVGLNLVGMRRSGLPLEEINAVRHAFKTTIRRNPPMPEMKGMLAELAKRSSAVKMMSDFVHEAKRPILPFGGRKVSNS